MRGEMKVPIFSGRFTGKKRARREKGGNPQEDSTIFNDIKR